MHATKNFKMSRGVPHLINLAHAHFSSILNAAGRFMHIASTIN
jgi:hypothetical protein